MSKKNGKQVPESKSIYFQSLKLEDVLCFKGQQRINLANTKGQPAQWTVILGNNNTGKTTLLRCIAALDVIIVEDPSPRVSEIYGIKLMWPDIHFDRSERFKISAKLLFQNRITDDEKKIEDVDYGFEVFNEEKKYMLPSWGSFGASKNLQTCIFSYGASRKMSKKSIAEVENGNTHASLFENEELANVEDWLLNLSLSNQLGSTLALAHLNLAKHILTSGILPDVKEVQLKSQEKGSGFENFVEFLTDYGWVRLRDLGYGYQTMIAWVLDLVRRMIERYSDLEDPLSGPAVVLVDEIDLHLHPDWQRRIIAHLTHYFPNVQFIVTAHSPLVVQSAEEINLVILKKEADHVSIEQPLIHSFKGWTVEEILTDLMQLEGQTMSQTYLDWMQRFDEALDEDDYGKAAAAYTELDKILHPESQQRKLMKIQMASIPPVETV